MARKLPEGYSKAFAKARAEGKDRFTLNGQTYVASGGRTHGRSLEELKGQRSAPETSPRPAPRPSATQTPGNSTRASSAPSRPSQRPSNSQSVAGDPRTSDGYNRIGASNPAAQSRTRSLPSTPSGSNLTRTAGSQADRSPPRTPPRRPQTPDGDSRPARSTTQTNTRPPVKASEITTLAQWKALTRNQRRNTPGVPDTMLDAIRKYGLGS